MLDGQRTQDELAAAMYGGSSAPAKPAATAEAPSSTTAAPGTRTMDELAAALYRQPSDTHGEAPAAADEAPAQRSSEQLADALYGDKGEELPPMDVPLAVKEMREADPLRSMYPAEVTYRNSLTEATLDEIAGADQLSEPQRAAALKEGREIAADFGFTDSDIATLSQVARAFSAEPPTDEMRQTWREQAVERLNQEYGEGAKQALRDARNFIGRDPRMARALDALGHGDHPDVVMTFARLARRAKSEGNPA